MNTSWIVPPLVLLLLVGCGRSPFPGFKPVTENVHFKLRMLGDGERLPTDSDSALVRIRMARHGEAPGSLFSTERWYGAIDGLIPEEASRAILFHEGDSVSLVATVARIPWSAIGAERGSLPDTAWVDLELSLFALRSREESRQLSEAVRTARTAADEDSTLARFFAHEPGEWPHFMGVFYQLDPKGAKRPKLQSGQVVTISYTGRFLETGEVFDDTYTSQQPLTFRLGDPGQVLRGLEIAIHLLSNKGKGRFIIPSDLAYGPTGSSSRIVPPWTPVLYEVQVTDAGAVTTPELLSDSSVAPL